MRRWCPIGPEMSLLWCRSCGLLDMTCEADVKARSYCETVWKPALAKAGLIATPVRDRRSRRRYVTTRKEGIHQLRHYYASVMLAGGVSIKELTEYLGHSDPAFTLRVYAHMLPCSYDRARAVITERFTRMTSPDVGINPSGQASCSRNSDGTAAT